MAKFIQVISYI